MASPAQRMGVHAFASTRPRGGTMVNVPKPKIQVDDGAAKTAIDRSLATHQPTAQGAAPRRDWMQMVQPPPSMGPYAQASPGYNPSPFPQMGLYAGGTWKGPMGSVPNHHGWAGLKPTVKIWTLRMLGAFPGLRFSSGYRTPAQNAAVNGHPKSGHMEGWKIDLSGDPRLLKQAALWAQQYGAKTLLHDAGSGYHLDISWRGIGA